MRHIYIVDDEPDVCATLALLVEDVGYKAITFSCGEDLLKKLKSGSPDLILLDRKMSPKMDGITVLSELKKMNINTQVIMLTAFADVDSVVTAMKMGAYDYVLKPFDRNILLHRIEKAIEKTDLESKVEDLQRRFETREFLEYMMGTSPQIKTVHQAIEKVTMTDFSVLVYGETGTGKEIVAKAVHDYSHRKHKPFIAVDCGSIPENLIESELFGYRKGAFTGAQETRNGRFQQADGGTIFLDEISNLTYELQKKLLRVVQERKVQKIGAKRLEPVDVRIISATNLPLDELVAKGQFRNDLYYRLDEFSIRIPPLRERRDDIPVLADRFLKEVLEKLKKGKRKLSGAALTALQNHGWPGNVRELQNIIRRAVLISDETIRPEHLALKLDRAVVSEIAIADIDYDKDFDLKQLKKDYTAKIEKRVIKNVLKKFKGNKSKSARYLKVDYKTLLSKIGIYGIDSIES
ncbi:MAG: sigma-54-dependent Fis family transcriptional regulator [Bacteroidetes bacterium]|nr:sigma-54-dependent Fis family transcriptional regulator [Bacteroidota bacterium]